MPALTAPVPMPALTAPVPMPALTAVFPSLSVSVMSAPFCNNKRTFVGILKRTAVISGVIPWKGGSNV